MLDEGIEHTQSGAAVVDNEPDHSNSDESDTQGSLRPGARYINGQYKNTHPTQDLRDDLTKFDVAKRYIFDKNPKAEPKTSLPLIAMQKAELEQERENSQIHLYRLGHSSILLKLASEYWLIDPVFSTRASPFSLFGPKRFHPAPLPIEQLPKIKGIIISHNHYDHLDEETIRRLRNYADFFVVPLGVKNILHKWGVSKDKITELDWWQSTAVGDVSITATPAQHFSGRSLVDGDATLWCSYAITFQGHSIFFSGDSGYFDGFKSIGDALGPFDIVIMEAGGYDKDWPDVHMTPEGAVDAYFDLGGRYLLPIHNGTFNLAFHDWQDPFEQVLKYSEVKGAITLFPRFGERVELEQPGQFSLWWRDVE
ncbi:MBL fold metallo-hydrolase [Aurantivibrio plasticivorans]